MLPSPHSPIPQDTSRTHDSQGGISSASPSPSLSNVPSSNWPEAQVSQSADGATDWRYESAVAEVEAIIAQIEAGDLELADIFEQFNRAVQYLQACEAYLKHHRQQVDILVETLTDEE